MLIKTPHNLLKNSEHHRQSPLNLTPISYAATLETRDTVPKSQICSSDAGLGDHDKTPLRDFIFVKSLNLVSFTK